MPAPLLETRDLSLISAIVAQGTVTRASQTLGLSQSALSHQLANLEERLGVPLFARAGRRLRITAQGQKLAQLAAEVLPRLFEVETQLQGFSAEPKVIRVSAECYTSYHWLPSLLRRFHAAHPDIEVRIGADATRDPIKALAAGDLDLALCFVDPQRRGYRATPLFKDELVFVMAPDHPLAAHRTLTQQDVAGAPLYTHEVPAHVGKRVRRQLFDSRGPLPRVTRIPFTNALVELAKAGMGLAFVTGWSAARELREGTLVARRMRGRRIPRQWYAVFREDSQLGPALKTLLTELVEVARPPAL